MILITFQVFETCSGQISSKNSHINTSDKPSDQATILHPTDQKIHIIVNPNMPNYITFFPWHLNL